MMKTFVYCGPPIKSAGLGRFDTFIGEPPKPIKKHAAASPAVRNLFVEPKNLAQVRSNMKRPGTKEHRWYKQAVKYIEEEV